MAQKVLRVAPLAGGGLPDAGWLLACDIVRSRATLFAPVSRHACGKKNKRKKSGCACIAALVHTSTGASVRSGVGAPPALPGAWLGADKAAILPRLKRKVRRQLTLVVVSQSIKSLWHDEKKNKQTIHTHARKQNNNKRPERTELARRRVTCCHAGHLYERLANRCAGEAD